MARTIALVGAKQGPWVPGQRRGSPFIHITNLPVGARILVEHMHETGEYSSLAYEFDGVHPLSTAAFFRVSCDKPQRGTICEIIHKRVA